MTTTTCPAATPTASSMRPAESDDPVGRALEALRAPGSADELRREDATVAAFHAARLAPASRSMSGVAPTTPRAAAVRAVAATGLVVALTSGGFALAATGHLPTLPDQASDTATEAVAGTAPPGRRVPQRDRHRGRHHPDAATEDLEADDGRLGDELRGDRVHRAPPPSHRGTADRRRTTAHGRPTPSLEVSARRSRPATSRPTARPSTAPPSPRWPPRPAARTPSPPTASTWSASRRRPASRPPPDPGGHRQADAAKPTQATTGRARRRPPQPTTRPTPQPRPASPPSARRTGQALRRRQARGRGQARDDRQALRPFSSPRAETATPSPEGWPSRAVRARLGGMDAVEAAFAAYPRAGFLPRVRTTPGGVRRAAADRRRPDQLPAPDRRRDAAPARGATGPAGARRRVRVGVDDGAAGPPGRPGRRGGRGRAGARAGRSSARPAWRPPTSRGRGSSRPHPGCSATRTTRRTTGSWSRPSPTRCPRELVDQLGPAGRMVIPVAGWMTLVVMPGPVITEHGPYRFVPLR